MAQEVEAELLRREGQPSGEFWPFLRWSYLGMGRPIKSDDDEVKINDEE